MRDLRTLSLLLAAFVPLAVAAVPSDAAGAGPLRTAVVDYEGFDGDDAAVVLQRVRAAGASAFRLDLAWRAVAPARRPADFRPENPADPAYRWESFDEKLRLLDQYGLDPIVAVHYPPAWAERASTPADPAELGRFLRAAGQRYSGRFEGLPRVRYWQIWIEPNVNKFFAPQFAGTRLVAPTLYRRLVNAAAAALHGVRPDNLVIAGGLSPFTVKAGATRAIGPLRFMRDLLCMSKGRAPKPTCKERTQFDIWAHHPYTSGGPTHTAFHPDDVSLGDLPEMKRLLTAAAKARRIVARRPVEFWVTEFSWDTSPPDPRAVPLKLQARWVAEALYRMWKLGIGLIAWLQLRDDPYPTGPHQSGLYYRGATMARDRPKLTLTAFRFPFVAFPERGRVFVWGRTPAGRAAAVVVERRSGKSYRRIGALRANRYGVFTGRLSARLTSRDVLRARIPAGGSGSSLDFSLARVPDRFVNPFG
ncbi:MAG: hypothetical protein H0U03_11000 [Actinobacteria bacterium]|nr:hypothetical protein [Actinomycetota bacterium]